MKKIEYSIVIKKPVKEVFRYLETLENRPEWEPGLIEAKVVSGKYDEPGSVIQITNQALGKKMETKAEVIEYVENSHVICRAEKPFYHEVTHLYEEVNGHTKFTRKAVADVEKKGGASKLALGMVAKKIEKTFQKTVVNAKEVLENSSEGIKK